MKKQNKQAGEFQEGEACGEQPVLLPSNATNECRTIPVQMVQKLADMLIDTKAAKEEAVRESERYRKENADLARRLEQSEWEKEQIRAECQAIKRASAVYLAERLAPSPPQQAAESPGMPDGTESAEAPLSEMGDAGDEPDGRHAAFRVHPVVPLLPRPHRREGDAHTGKPEEESRYGTPPSPRLDVRRHRRRQRDAPPQQRGKPVPEPCAESCVIMC